MTSRLVIVGVVIAAALVITLLSLIRARRLNERYALLWLIAAVLVILFGLWPAALNALANVFGIAYPPSALFLLVGLILGLVLLDTAIVISKLVARASALAQHMASTEERVRVLEERLDPGYSSAEGTASAAESSAPDS